LTDTATPRLCERPRRDRPGGLSRASWSSASMPIIRVGSSCARRARRCRGVIREHADHPCGLSSPGWGRRVPWKHRANPDAQLLSSDSGTT
jgi:hypothetical protein